MYHIFERERVQEIYILALFAWLVHSINLEIKPLKSTNVGIMWWKNQHKQIKTPDFIQIWIALPYFDPSYVGNIIPQLEKNRMAYLRKV